MTTVPLYLAAALAEIAGCYGIWAWHRLGRGWPWALGGLACLALFGWLLARVEADAAGRAYAAYGGIYVACALLWLWAAEGVRPDRWDLLGVALCLSGTAVILLAPRG
jgi:small multidrug resistance family-3 protein